ncbi:hypothetical protein VPNG_08187 [Cytospora leucostoma]|uniref:Ketoreductase (KR) domain-containing protein n=1 Tax=Cytospora leucostoma TaxID=1230097 RepID=A0A423W7C3_9PEZI|nr:hypothetical protein VPNG_08187 [Cytospora leucostoma]
MATKLGATPVQPPSLIGFFRQQYTFKPEEVRGVSLSGKTAIVTGANTGLGFETARQLLSLGLSKLILAVRNEDKGRAAAAKMLSSSSPPDTIDVWHLDLDVYESVVAFAERARRELTRLDIVNLNAGIAPTERKFNESTGHDEIIQVNYLSTSLLAILLLQVAKEKKASQPSRFTFTSSELTAWTKFRERAGSPLFTELDKGGKVDTMDRMVVSKLMVQFFVAKVAELVDPSVAIINASSPGGLCDSELYRDRDEDFLAPLMKLVLRLLFNTCAVGARMMTDALVRHGEETHGQFLSFQKVVPMAPILYTPEGKTISDQLWRETISEFAFANVEEILKTITD